MLQTTGNAQLGGVQLGRCRLSYQGPGLKMAPLEAVTSTRTAMTKADILDLLSRLGHCNIQVGDDRHNGFTRTRPTAMPAIKLSGHR
jgi:hypothetical protein